MAGDDVAFAGLAGQIELVRSGAVSARELVELSLNRIERIDRGESAEQIAAATATEAGGLTLGLRAAMMALTRVFRRFFLPYQPAS